MLTLAHDLGRTFRTTRKKASRRPGIRAASLSINPGERIALIGRNGSGKSTLLRLIAGITNKETGEAPVAQTDDVALVLAKPMLDDALNVRQNLRLFDRLRGGTAIKSQDDDVISKALDLAELIDRRVGKLSTGMQRRADLARALLSQPRVLLLDEPTSGLDAGYERAFWSLVRNREKAKAMATVVATHQFSETLEADRVMPVIDGSLSSELAQNLLQTLDKTSSIVRVAQQFEAQLPTDLPRWDTPNRVCTVATPELLSRLTALIASGGGIEISQPTIDDLIALATSRAASRTVSRAIDHADQRPGGAQ